MFVEGQRFRAARRSGQRVSSGTEEDIRRESVQGMGEEAPGSQAAGCVHGEVGELADPHLLLPPRAKVSSAKMSGDVAGTWHGYMYSPASTRTRALPDWTRSVWGCGEGAVPLHPWPCIVLPLKTTGLRHGPCPGGFWLDAHGRARRLWSYRRPCSVMAPEEDGCAFALCTSKDEQHTVQFTTGGVAAPLSARLPACVSGGPSRPPSRRGVPRPWLHKESTRKHLRATLACPSHSSDKRTATWVCLSRGLARAELASCGSAMGRIGVGLVQ